MALGPAESEDSKIIILARSSLARTRSRQAACLRDADGRTYAGTNITLRHLTLSAVQVVVAMAVSSGAPGVEAVAVCGEPPTTEDLAVIGDLRGSIAVIVWVTDPTGVLLERIEV